MSLLFYSLTHYVTCELKDSQNTGADSGEKKIQSEISALIVINKHVAIKHIIRNGFYIVLVPEVQPSTGGTLHAHKHCPVIVELGIYMKEKTE